MAARFPPSSKEIIALLGKLKGQTPDYPAHLLAARKTVFLKHAATLKIQGDGTGGEAGGQGGSAGSGGPGTMLGGSSAAQGIALQSAIGMGLVATMLIGAYLLRDQVSGWLEEDRIAAVETAAQTIVPVTGASEEPTGDAFFTATPDVTATVTITATAVENYTGVDNEQEDPSDIDDLLDLIKDNPGLHLGQATGTPAAPGQGNPGNENQPEKPDKPDKPDKPGKPR